MSGTGEIIKKDIPVCDDSGKENEGDQRQQHQAYNSKANNYFVVWWDERPTTQNAAVYARIINADGEPAGNDFSLVDAPKPQIFCSPRYHEKTDRIFAVWDDMRDADLILRMQQSAARGIFMPSGFCLPANLTARRFLLKPTTANSGTPS